MIRSWFGLDVNPFDHEDPALLAHQREILETLQVHCQQGGLCLLLGEPGSGKSVIKNALRSHDPKRLVVPTVSRTLHTYYNTLRILCQAFEIDADGGDYKCETRLIAEAHRLNRAGKSIAPVIDDAHYMPIQCLRKLRLLFEDFPKNHNLILIGQPALMSVIALTVNEDIRSRVTYSALLAPLAPDAMSAFILGEFDRCGLGHNALTDEALQLIVRSSEGLLRRARNLTIASLLAAARDSTRTASQPRPHPTPLEERT
jgi:type II secretory pathway predicted ATPase ExeA